MVDAAGGGRSLVAAVENKLEGTGGWDPLTEADIRAQRLILSLLSHRWPSLRIVGEEDGCEEAAASKGLAKSLLEEQSLKEDIVNEEEVPSALKELPIEDLCLFVDPLDGTKEFTKGNYPAVQTLIGIALRGRPIAGVMHAPFHAPVGSSQPGAHQHTHSEHLAPFARTHETHTHEAHTKHSLTCTRSHTHIHSHSHTLSLSLGYSFVVQRPLPSPSPPTFSSTPSQEHSCLTLADYKGATVYGIVGGGCHGLSQFPPVEQGDRLVVTTSASRGSPKLLPILEAMEPCDFLRCGGAGNKFMHLLRGAAHVYVFPDPYTSLWDTCAGEACLLAKFPNAKVTDCHAGEQLLYTEDNDPNNSRGILATVDDHAKYLLIAQKAITKL